MVPNTRIMFVYKIVQEYATVSLTNFVALLRVYSYFFRYEDMKSLSGGKKNYSYNDLKWHFKFWKQISFWYLLTDLHSNPYHQHFRL